MRFFVKLFLQGQERDYGPTRLIELGGIPADRLTFTGSRAYFCRGCGRIWATWTKEDSFDLYGQNWHAHNRTCPDHEFGSYYSDTPGSLVDTPLDILVLNRELLEYEFLTLMEKHHERPSYARNRDSDGSRDSPGSSGTDQS